MIRMARRFRFIAIFTTAFIAAAARADAPATLRDRATKQIVASTRSEDPFLRANAVEASQHLSDRVRPVVHLALDDAHPAVRFAALATVGRLRLKDMLPAVRQGLDDKDASVRAAAIFALRRCGADADLTPLADLLTSQDPRSRGNAALLLGMLGDNSAVPMLKDTARAPLNRADAVEGAIARLQVAEAVVRLGDDSSLDAIRAAAYSPFDEARVLAVQVLGDLRDKRMERAFVEMLAKPPVELQLAAARSLAALKNPVGLDVALQGAKHALPQVRAQAAHLLRKFDDPRAITALGALLDDPHEQPRLAAAAAILTPADAP